MCVINNADKFYHLLTKLARPDIIIRIFSSKTMKNSIHPTFYTDTKVTCACGNSFVTGSTVQEIHTEICSNCHPFYTGKQKLVDTAGTVDKFTQRRAKAAEIKATIKEKKPRKTRVKK